MRLLSEIPSFTTQAGSVSPRSLHQYGHGILRTWCLLVPLLRLALHLGRSFTARGLRAEALYFPAFRFHYLDPSRDTAGGWKDVRERSIRVEAPRRPASPWLGCP